MTRMPETIGRFALHAPLSRGGAGSLFAATDPAAGSAAVILRVLPAPDPARRNELLEMARRLRRLDHPAFVRVLEAGAHDDVVWWALEPGEASTLTDLIASDRLPPLRARLSLLVEVFRAAAAAFAEGVSGLDIGTDAVWCAADGADWKFTAYPSPPRPPEDAQVPESDEAPRLVLAAAGLLAQTLATGAVEGGDDLASVVRRAAALSPSERFPDLTALADAMAGVVERLDRGEARADRLPVYDEDVQFTVYRPKRLAPGVWDTLLVFAHLESLPADAAPGTPDPLEEVQRQAAALLGDPSGHGQQTVDSSMAVPREGTLTVVPSADGITFNPPSASFQWVEPVHREEFRMRAGAEALGTIVRGRVSVFLGSIILADIPLTVRVDGNASAGDQPRERASARPYRRIFASYSHSDMHVVEEFARYADALGDKYLRDVVDLRSGERWNDALKHLIGEADVFQLFWSWNALHSPYVREEWQYALALGRPSFIRPVYWDDPLPSHGELPPPSLRALHFERIRPLGVTATTAHTGTHAVPAAAAPARPPAGSVSEGLNRPEGEEFRLREERQAEEQSRRQREERRERQELREREKRVPVPVPSATRGPAPVLEHQPRSQAPPPRPARMRVIRSIGSIAALLLLAAMLWPAVRQFSPYAPEVISETPPTGAPKGGEPTGDGGLPTLADPEPTEAPVPAPAPPPPPSPRPPSPPPRPPTPPTVPDSGTTQTGNRVRPVTAVSLLTVSVRDAAGAPVAGAVVVVRGDDAETPEVQVVTDDNGEARVRLSGSRTYAVQISKPGFADLSERVDATSRASRLEARLLRRQPPGR